MVERQRVKDLWYGTFSQGKQQPLKTEKLCGTARTKNWIE